MAYSISPSGAIFLCSVPLENDYLNTITFSSHEAQQQYFQSKVEFSFTDYLYVKKDNTIKVDRNIDDLLTCNYLFYRNYGYGGTLEKTYYCFITNKRYINENTTELTIETDVFQTWQIELIWKPCFVNREHVNDDSIGANTIDENLETGDTIINSYETLAQTNTYYTCIGLTDNVLERDKNNIVVKSIPINNVNNYNGITSGNYYIVLDNSSSGGYNATKLIALLNKYGKIDNIYSLFMIPSYLIKSWEPDKLIIDDLEIHYYSNIGMSERAVSILDNKQISMNTTLNGYTPKNNKLYTYPYNYLEVLNNDGSSYIYHYENFINNTPTFNIDGTLNEGCNIVLYPLNYNRLNEPSTPLTDTYRPSYANGLSLGKFPLGSWNKDSYNVWLLQNSGIIKAQQYKATSELVIGGGKTTLGLITGSIKGGVSGIEDMNSGIANLLEIEGQLQKSRYMSNDIGGTTGSGNVTYSLNFNCFQANKRSIKVEYAKIIDNYFTMYGYKVNRLKKPNIYGRKNWNYVKTIGCNVECNEAPTEDIDKLRKIFDKGITLWHTTDVGDYNLDNSIV